MKYYLHGDEEYPNGQFSFAVSGVSWTCHKSGKEIEADQDGLNRKFSLKHTDDIIFRISGKLPKTLQVSFHIVIIESISD